MNIKLRRNCPFLHYPVCTHFVLQLIAYLFYKLRLNNGCDAYARESVLGGALPEW